MELGRLRNLLEVQVHRLSQSSRHIDLPGICEQLGLSPPPREDEGSKAQRMAAALSAVSDLDLPSSARRLLTHFPPVASERNAIEELLWAGDSAFDIPKRFRRDVAKALSLTDLWIDSRRFGELLDRCWVLDVESSICDHHGLLRDEIAQHVFKNQDVSTDELFGCLGAYDCTSRRFALFLEGLASPDVRPDEAEQRRFVQTINKTLRRCGVELRETGNEGGYPVFTMVSLFRGNQGRPKNLIFASPVKPDLRFRDAVNNDIEIVANADRVLVYDRPIGTDGLRWRDLQSWWADAYGIASEEESKRTLYRRLKESLPEESPPQRLLFRAFFESFRSEVPALPALLPEVWLHWDPKTVRERGPDALARFRMDFLLLLPANVRIVIEVDGKSHYTDENGRACATKYAAMMAADRDLRLAGYDVYRFGAVELESDDDVKRVKDFFAALFKKYGVTAER
ncbi:hypothetical protein [Sorangium cellulosum]|uniref:AbiJ-related protein n=1 Tax=Sorangium cellulosum TaxID=56 RepID=UPI001F5D1200|nr:hypothetical protein [Sorangium cellulosum]